MALAPINLSEAAQDFATGDFGDLEPGDILLEFAPMFQPPYVLAGIGLAMGILCGLTFARLVQNKLDGWKQDRLALLPLGNFETNLPYTGIIVGITLFIGGSLQIFGFSSGAALLVAFVLSMATAGALWVQLERLENLLQVVENDDGGGGATDLLPVAGAGLKLLVGEEGKSLRQRLLLTLVRDNRLNTDDLRGLMQLLGRTFSPRRVAGRLLTRLNPLAA